MTRPGYADFAVYGAWLDQNVAPDKDKRVDSKVRTRMVQAIGSHDGRR